MWVYYILIDDFMKVKLGKKNQQPKYEIKVNKLKRMTLHWLIDN